MAELYVAIKTFGYGSKDGVQEFVDPGQVIPLKGLPNDDLLVQMRFLTPLGERNNELAHCAECGADFIGINYRTSHGDMRHPDTLEGSIEAPQLIKEARTIRIPGTPEVEVVGKKD